MFEACARREYSLSRRGKGAGNEFEIEFPPILLKHLSVYSNESVACRAMYIDTSFPGADNNSRRFESQHSSDKQIVSPYVRCCILPPVAHSKHVTRIRFVAFLRGKILVCSGLRMAYPKMAYSQTHRSWQQKHRSCGLSNTKTLTFAALLRWNFHTEPVLISNKIFEKYISLVAAVLINWTQKRWEKSRLCMRWNEREIKTHSF